MKEKKRISIKVSVAIYTIIFMGILTTTIASIGYKLYYDNVIESYVNYAETVLEYAYRKAEKYSFGDMIAHREMPKDYEVFRTELNEIKDCSDIEYLYAIYFDDIADIHSLTYAINAKTKKEQSSGLPLSELFTYMGIPVEEGGFEDETLLILQQAVKDKKRKTGTLTGYSDVYGHMLNGYHVVFDRYDHPVGLLCVEIDINRINLGLYSYARTVLLAATVFTILIILLFVYYAKRYLTDPIMKIIKSSTSFVEEMNCGTEPNALVYADTQIRSHGDIGMLAENVKSLADSVKSYMTNLKAATAERERINTELSLATKIQEGMLPNIWPPFPARTEFDIYASMDPAKEVGGDFYDLFMIDDDHLCMVMADVSGKGIPAALFMMAAKIILSNNAMQGKTPAKILEDANTAICANQHEEMFVTVWLGILTISTGRLVSANAGHEYPVIKMPNEDFLLIKDKHGFVIGGLEGVKYKEFETTLLPGAKLFVYTDGVPEATNAEGAFFGTDRMTKALNEAADKPPKEILAHVRQAIDGFVENAEQFDDLTMLCMEYKGGRTDGIEI